MCSQYFLTIIKPRKVHDTSGSGSAHAYAMYDIYMKDTTELLQHTIQATLWNWKQLIIALRHINFI